MISINAKISGVTFDVKVDDNVNILTGYSGTGKTFMFKAITEYLKANGMRCIYFDNTAMNFSEKALKEACNNKELIIFDNADLYLTQGIIDYARNIGTVIISMKLAFNLKLKPYSVYKISYTDDKVVLINKSKDVAVRC